MINRNRRGAGLAAGLVIAVALSAAGAPSALAEGRDVDGAEARPASGGRLRESRAGGHHRLEERQRDGHTHTVEERPPRQMFFCDEHKFLCSVRLQAD